MAFSIADYADLQTYVSKMAGGSSDTDFATAVQLAIHLAEAEMNNKLRVEEMMVRSIETVDEDWESCPVGFLDLRSAFYVASDTRDYPLKRTSPERIAWYNRFNGNPKALALVGLQYKIAPRTTEAIYSVRMHFYRRVPDLSADNPCTAILSRYPALYLYGALANLRDWLAGDERLDRWEAQFQSLIMSANAATGHRARVNTGP